MCTGAGRQPATAGCFGTLRASPPRRNAAAVTSTGPTSPELGVGGSGGGAPGAPAQRGGRVRGGGPRSGAARWGQAAAEPSAAGGGTATARPAMSSGPEPRPPRTLFSIADILGPRMVARGPSTSPLPESNPGPPSPLCALEELTSKTLRGLGGHAPESSEGCRPQPTGPLPWGSGRPQRSRARWPDPAPALLCPVSLCSHSLTSAGCPQACCLPYPGGLFHFMSPTPTSA
ncbi:transcription factor LBX2 isoform X2 [Vulpes lagopus]|uniref:transcription factor LBX2 isoform X2 n=1 Tax=Vulpes lagopus TaxID=494514 RepID=UPI001BCA3A2D|nr:transcription factor LBX2 isoform X2 [Vulpes lagopus]